MTNNGYMTLEAWELKTPQMVKGIIKLPIIQYATDNWWVLYIVDVFGDQTSIIKQKEDDTLRVCYSYDQDYENQYKASFMDDTSVLR